MKITVKQINATRRQLGLHPHIQGRITNLYDSEVMAKVQTTQHARNEQPNFTVYCALWENDVVPITGFTTEEMIEGFKVCGLRPPKVATVNAELNKAGNRKVKKKWFMVDGGDYAEAKFKHLLAQCGELTVVTPNGKAYVLPDYFRP